MKNNKKIFKEKCLPQILFLFQKKIFKLHECRKQGTWGFYVCCDRVHVSSHFQLCDSAMIFWPSLFTVTKGKSSMMCLFQEYIRCVRYPVSWSKISLWSLNLVVTCINFTCILKYTWTSFGYPPKKYMTSNAHDMHII